MQLIKVSKNEQGQQIVSAKDLWKFLDVNYDFSTWIKRRIEKYDFMENEDFIVVSLIPQNCGIKKGGDRRSIDYILTIDMAKELSMVENNLSGRLARKYFIQCEKSYKKLREKEVHNLKEKNKGQRAVEYIFHNNSAVRKYAKEVTEEVFKLEREIKEKDDIVKMRLTKLKALCKLLSAYAFPTEKDKIYGVVDNKYIY